MSERRCPRSDQTRRGKPLALAMAIWVGLTLSAAPGSSEPVSREPSDHCLDSLTAVHQPMGKLTEDAVAEFLGAVHSHDCRANLDFKEWSTETIYDLMQDAPETFFAVLMRSPKPIQTSVVKALEGPVDLFVDYAAIYESISTGVRDKQLREYALAIFTPQYQRHLKEQREWEKLNRPQGMSPQG